MDLDKEDICQLAYEGKCDKVKELVLKNNKYPTKQDDVSAYSSGLCFMLITIEYR